jgi:hypothetical protein
MNKFEQLIEYVINDDESKARELFHEIVVEKSREIYENLMDEEAVTEADDEELEESFGEPDADSSDNLINDVETEEEGMAEEDEEGESDAEFDDEAEEAGADVTKDIEGEGDLEDRVVDLEDKLDELMAEFESMMGDEPSGDEFGGDDMGGDDVGDDMGGDAMAQDDTQAMGNDDEMTMEVSVRPMGEAISLKAAPKPVTSEEGGVNKKSTVAANAGARGAMASPVRMTGDTAQGRPAPSTKELIGKVGNSPAQSTGQKLSPATKPHLAQATGVNTKSPLARS